MVSMPRCGCQGKPWRKCFGLPERKSSSRRNMPPGSRRRRRPRPRRPWRSPPPSARRGVAMCRPRVLAVGGELAVLIATRGGDHPAFDLDRAAGAELQDLRRIVGQRGRRDHLQRRDQRHDPVDLRRLRDLLSRAVPHPCPRHGSRHRLQCRALRHGPRRPDGRRPVHRDGRILPQGRCHLWSRLSAGRRGHRHRRSTRRARRARRR